MRPSNFEEQLQILLEKSGPMKPTDLDSQLFYLSIRFATHARTGDELVGVGFTRQEMYEEIFGKWCALRRQDYDATIGHLVREGLVMLQKDKYVLTNKTIQLCGAYFLEDRI